MSHQEKAGIETSIATLDKRLFEEFDNSVVSKRLIFGSYARQTMLPRWMDEQSDVDYMVVFADSNREPQTYLDRLKRFTERRYSSSTRYQDHPTIALDLNHIRFELVPAKDATIWTGLQIPAKGAIFKWMETSPDAFSKDLDAKDQRCNGLIRPLVRLAKYWNARSGYVFESYGLEQKIVAHNFLWVPETLEAYFFSFMDTLNASWDASQKSKDKIANLKQSLQTVRRHLNSQQELVAAMNMARLLPAKETVAP
jgi:predicted nucleotidyltransferase